MTSHHIDKITDHARLAEYAQTHDFADDIIESGAWETETASDPMVTTSLRLPKSLLDWVRQTAALEHTRPTVLIRYWIEQHRDADTGAPPRNSELATRVERLERAVFRESA